MTGYGLLTALNGASVAFFTWLGVHTTFDGLMLAAIIVNAIAFGMGWANLTRGVR